MTDQPTPSTEPTTTSAHGDETFEWTQASGAEAEGRSAAATGREWLSQLQSMIENAATQAGPVLRDVAVKAAELAAVAGEKAGPVAARAAEFTADAGQRIAERSRGLATELRRDQAATDGETPAASGAEAGSELAGEDPAAPAGA